MKKCILLTLFAITPWLLYPQNTTIDSLTNLLSNTSDASNQIRLKCEISQQYTEIGELGVGEKIAKEALASAIKNKDKKNTALAYYTLGRLNQYYGYLKEALTFHNEAMPLFAELELQEELAWTYLNIGITQRALDDLQKAIEYDKKALEIFKKLKHKQGIAYSYINLGLAFNSNEEYGRAIQQMLNAKNICNLTNDHKGLGYVFHSLGEIYENIGDYNESVKANLACFPLKEKENDKMGMALSHANLSSAYYKQGAIKEAEQIIIEGVRLAKHVNSEKALEKLYLTWSKVDSLNGKYQSALNHYQKHAYNYAVLNNEQQKGKISELKHTVKKMEEEIKSMRMEQGKPSQEKGSGVNKLSIILSSLVLSLFLIVVFLALKLKKLSPR